MLRAFALLHTITTPIAMAVKALSGPVNLPLYPKVIIAFIIYCSFATDKNQARPEHMYINDKIKNFSPLYLLFSTQNKESAL